MIIVVDDSPVMGCHGQAIIKTPITRINIDKKNLLIQTLPNLVIT